MRDAILTANIFVQHGGNVALTKIRDDGHNGLTLVFGASRQLQGGLHIGARGDTAKNAFNIWKKAKS